MKKKVKITTIIIGILLFLWYTKLPDYEVINSMIVATDNTKHTTLQIVVYKAHYNPYLYQMIADRHNDINGTPTKLTLQLYFSKRAIQHGKKPYRTIVFDYGDHIEYTLLDSLW